MGPNFTVVLAGGIAFALCVLAFVGWRFGVAGAVAFAIVSGGFTAIMDFASSYAAHNYTYPGQSQLWVFSYVFWGWIAVCGMCLLLAEGILARPDHDMLTQPRLWWQVPLLTAIIAVIVDLFVDPVAVSAGYWVWFVPGRIYFGIPLLNFVGWFVLMLLAPLAWIQIVRRPSPGWQKIAIAVASLVPLIIAAALLSTLLNGAVALAGLQ